MKNIVTKLPRPYVTLGLAFLMSTAACDGRGDAGDVAEDHTPDITNSSDPTSSIELSDSLQPPSSIARANPTESRSVVESKPGPKSSISIPADPSVPYTGRTSCENETKTPDGKENVFSRPCLK